MTNKEAIFLLSFIKLGINMKLLITNLATQNKKFWRDLERCDKLAKKLRRRDRLKTLK